MAQSSLGVGAPRHYLTQLFEGQACTITIADLRPHKQNCDSYLYAKVSAHSRDSAYFIDFFGHYSGRREATSVESRSSSAELDDVSVTIRRIVARLESRVRLLPELRKAASVGSFAKVLSRERCWPV